MPRKKSKVSASATNKDGPSKSPHFKFSGNKDRETDRADSGDDTESSVDRGSDFAEESDHDHDSSSSASSEEDETSDEQPTRKRKAAPKSSTRKQATTAKPGSELWREGVTTGLPYGTQVIIKKPKARSIGKTPYSDGSIHPNTLLFLADLKANNDREWFKSEPRLYNCFALDLHHSTSLNNPS